MKKLEWFVKPSSTQIAEYINDTLVPAIEELQRRQKEEEPSRSQVLAGKLHGHPIEDLVKIAEGYYKDRFEYGWRTSMATVLTGDYKGLHKALNEALFGPESK